MSIVREWLKTYKLLIGGAVIVLSLGFVGILAATYKEPSAAQTAQKYATVTTCGSLPVTQFADAEAEVNIRFQNGVMDYELDLKDQSGAMMKWVSEHPKGDFYVEWQNSGEKTIGKVSIPFRNFTGNLTSMKASAQTPCEEALYGKF